MNEIIFRMLFGCFSKDTHMAGIETGKGLCRTWSIPRKFWVWELFSYFSDISHIVLNMHQFTCEIME
jgi:hypothetical protein